MDASSASPVRRRRRLATPRRAPLGALLAVCLAALPAAGQQAVGLGRPLRDFHTPPTGAAVTDVAALGLLSSADDAWQQSRRRGAELAVSQAVASGRRVVLHAAQVSGPWGTAAEVARDLVVEQGCAALITPPDGAVAHLMQQVAAKEHVPLVCLSSESSLTRVPVPWLVRAVPDRRAQLHALLEALGPVGGVSLPAVVPPGRDGRELALDLAAVGAARGQRFDPILSWCEDLAWPLERSDGPLLVWLEGEAAAAALAELADHRWRGPLLLPRETLEGGLSLPAPLRAHSVRRFDVDAADESFVREYSAAYGLPPDEAAAVAYDAARLLLDALEQAGNDRASIRDWLSAAPVWRGVAGTLAFDGTGNLQGPCAVRRLGAGTTLDATTTKVTR